MTEREYNNLSWSLDFVHFSEITMGPKTLLLFPFHIFILSPAISRDIFWFTALVQKYKRFKKIAWIWSHHLHLQYRFKLMAGKLTWGNKAKHCWVISTNLLFLIVCLHRPAMFCLYSSSLCTFPHIIWIFPEGEGDEIDSRLSS